MGLMKHYWMEQLEERTYEDEKAQWIRHRLQDPDADESTPGWDRLSALYDADDLPEDYEEDEWRVEGKTRIEIFNENIAVAKELLNASVSKSKNKNLVVMLYGHVVTAVEAYLSATFIHHVLASEEHLQRLVENDPVFADRKFSLKEIYARRAKLQDEVRDYLRDLIFHDIAKVKPLFQSVLQFDFGDAKWLFKAVAIRHHCVHRAGYDKNGDEIDLIPAHVKNLMKSCTELVHRIEGHLARESDDLPF